MTMQTDDIAVFLAVVREGSFGRAAASLLVSQPAISERVARLERAAGASLFHRSTRGAALTPAGDAFLPYARRTLGLLDEATATLQALDEAPRLRVAVHATFAHRVVPLVLRSLHAVRRSVKVRDTHSDTIVAALLDGGCDAGFVVRERGRDSCASWPCRRTRSLPSWDQPIPWRAGLPPCVTSPVTAWRSTASAPVPPNSWCASAARACPNGVGPSAPTR